MLEAGKRHEVSFCRHQEGMWHTDTMIQDCVRLCGMWGQGIHTCKFTTAALWTHVEARVRCQGYRSLSYGLETGSVTEPEAHQFQPGCLSSKLSESLSLPPNARAKGMSSCASSLCGFWGLEIRSSRLQCEHSHPLSHLLRPLSLFNCERKHFCCGSSL